MAGKAQRWTADSRLPPEHPDLVKVFWDPAEGADFLAWKRRGTH